MWEMWVWSLGREDPLDEGMATHSSILAWRIQWTEETGGLQSIGLQRVRHDWSDLARMYALWTEYCWLTMLRQFQVEAKGLSHTYSYTHSPPTFPPIQTVTELIFVFVSLFINVILVCKIPDLQKKCPLSQKYPFGNFMINRKNCAGTIRKPLEKEMATHSSILSWKIPCTEEAGK